MHISRTLRGPVTLGFASLTVSVDQTQSRIGARSAPPRARGRHALRLYWKSPRQRAPAAAVRTACQNDGSAPAMQMCEQGVVAVGVSGAAVEPLTLAIHRGAPGSQGVARSVRAWVSAA